MHIKKSTISILLIFFLVSLLTGIWFWKKRTMDAEIYNYKNIRTGSYIVNLEYDTIQWRGFPFNVKACMQEPLVTLSSEVSPLKVLLSFAENTLSYSLFSLKNFSVYSKDVRLEIHNQKNNRYFLHADTASGEGVLNQSLAYKMHQVNLGYIDNVLNFDQNFLKAKSLETRGQIIEDQKDRKTIMLSLNAKDLNISNKNQVPSYLSKMPDIDHVDLHLQLDFLKPESSITQKNISTHMLHLLEAQENDENFSGTLSGDILWGNLLEINMHSDIDKKDGGLPEAHFNFRVKEAIKFAEHLVSNNLLGQESYDVFAFFLKQYKDPNDFSLGIEYKNGEFRIIPSIEKDQESQTRVEQNAAQEPTADDTVISSGNKENAAVSSFDGNVSPVLMETPEKNMDEGMDISPDLSPLLEPEKTSESPGEGLEEKTDAKAFDPNLYKKPFRPL